MRHRETSRPWWLQFNYIVILVISVVMPFCFLPGQRPLLLLLLFGVAICFQFNAKTSTLKVKKPIDLKFYLAWAVWAFLTGLVVADVIPLFMKNSLILLRTVLLLWSAYVVFYREEKWQFYLVCVIIVALINGVANTLGFQMDKNVLDSGGAIVQEEMDLSKGRASGLTGNANAMGNILLYAIWACLTLWKCRKGVLGLFFRCLFVGLICIFSYYIVYSGSRKTLLAVCLLLMIWSIWIVPSKLSIKNALVVLLLGGIVMSVFVLMYDFIMTETFMGARFQNMIDDGGGNAAVGFMEKNTRYLMYVDGFKMWLEHPIAGIGLGQFVVHFFDGHYSHSDYMEPLACTGLVGFILYHGFASSILIRLCKLKHFLPKNMENELYLIKCMIAFLVINHFFVGFGTPWWYNVEHCLLLVYIGAFSWRMREVFVYGKYVYAS